MNKLQEVVQKFRSGSVDTDKIPFMLGVEETRSRSFSTNEADQLKTGLGAVLNQREMQSEAVTLTDQTTQEQESSTIMEIAVPVEKKPYKKKPAGTFEYQVKEGDTLGKIGAHFDVTPSELMKVNKLLSRTVFVGQTLFIPDSSYASSAPSTPKAISPLPTNASPVPDQPPRTENLQGSLSPKAVDRDVTAAGAGAIVDEMSKIEEEEVDREAQLKFLKMPVRRILELDKGERTNISEDLTVKGMLLVTPNAIMFDPDVCDPAVISAENQQQFSMVIYMEEIKGVALFHDLSPRMFWKQPKELRAHSPRPEPYRAGQAKRQSTGGDSKSGEQPSEVSDPNCLRPAAADPCKLPDQHRPSLDDGDNREAALRNTAENVDQSDELTRRKPTEIENSQTVPLDYAADPSQPKPAAPSPEPGMPQPHCDSEFSSGTECQSDICSSTAEVEHLPSDALRADSHIFPEQINGNAPHIEHQGSAGHDSMSFEPIPFTDKSPQSVAVHPIPVLGETMPQSPVSSTEVNLEDSTGSNQIQQLSSSLSNDQPVGNLSPSNNGTLSDKDGESPTLTSNPAPKGDKSPSSAKKLSKKDNSWSMSGEAQNLVGKLAFQVSHLSWELVDNLDQDSAKLKDSTPSFSPLRTPGKHISSFFNYTSNLLRSAVTTDKESESPPPTATDSKSKYSWLPSSPLNKFQLKSEFTKADISRAMGKDAKDFLRRSDSHFFVDSPMYLQIRHGFRKDSELHQPRAFDHWNMGPMLDEYWFVVPHHMGDKLYSFLIAWQPDAYGDEEETGPRERFFCDAQSAQRGQGNLDELSSSDELRDIEKSWEILCTTEASRAERDHALYRQDTIDECNFPDLIGSSVIFKQEHIRDILRSLPRSMSVGYNWELVYGTHKHGYSMQNLYMRTECGVEDDSPVLLFIMDTEGTIFGAYMSNTMRQSDTFYGSGSTFLFTFNPEFKKYPWSGDNQFFMHGTKDYFSIGSGEGAFGLWLDSALDKGRSQKCTTFLNDVLSREEDFSIMQLELWRFVDSSQC